MNLYKRLHLHKGREHNQTQVEVDQGSSQNRRRGVREVTQ